MSLKKIFSLSIFIVICISSVSKVYSIEPDIFVQSTVNRAAKTLGGNLTKEERIIKLKEQLILKEWDTTHLGCIEKI